MKSVSFTATLTRPHPDHTYASYLNRGEVIMCVDFVRRFLKLRTANPSPRKIRVSIRPTKNKNKNTYVLIYRRYLGSRWLMYRRANDRPERNIHSLLIKKLLAAIGNADDGRKEFLVDVNIEEVK